MLADSERGKERKNRERAGKHSENLKQREGKGVAYTRHTAKTVRQQTA